MLNGTCLGPISAESCVAAIRWLPRPDALQEPEDDRPVIRLPLVLFEWVRLLDRSGSCLMITTTEPLDAWLGFGQFLWWSSPPVHVRAEVWLQRDLENTDTEGYCLGADLRYVGATRQRDTPFYRLGFLAEDLVHPDARGEL